MAETGTKQLVYSYDLQTYLSLDGEETWVRVTEVNSLDTTRDSNDYTTSYIERKTQSTYRLGTTDSVAIEVDAVGPNGIQSELAKYEDTPNVPCVYLRTLNYDFEKGAAAPASARVAKKAPATLNVDPFAPSSGNPLRISATVTMTGDYVKGTFDEESSAFTEAQAGPTA